jgi:hypothetical protein
MANEPITFYCPACGIKLTVPASLAGVTGPCPSCRTQIQAPIPAAPPVQQIPAAPAYQAPPVSYPPAGIPAAPPPPQAPVYQEPPPVAAAPQALKPEPRQLPNRSHPEEVVARQMPAGNGQPTDPKKLQPAPLPRHSHRTSPLVRFAMLLLFLIAAAVLVYGVLKILNMEPGQEKPSIQTPTQTQSSTPDKTPLTVETIPAAKTPPPAPLPTPPSEQPVLSEPPPKLPDGIEPKLPGVIAAEVLEKFLTAKSLAERLPMIETKTPEAELTQSCLAGPLPAYRNLAIDVQESNPVEEVVDFYYNVDFEAPENRINPHTLLVRTRGRGDPMVVVDPFLDLYGGRLAAYAANPTDKGGTFQVIVYAVANCTNEKIRDRDKKLTLKLLARDNTKEIAQAYFSKVSKIGEMLMDGTYSLSYGKAKACTVMLRWNTEEQKDHPYLEAIGLKALDWNP